MPTTPPNSDRLPLGGTLSDTTPLRKELCNAGPHSSLPPKSNAGSLYKDMTFDACEKFVGPMAVEDFLSEFVPSKTEKSRPTITIPFSHPTVSENEGKFVHIPTLIDAFVLSYAFYRLT